MIEVKINPGVCGLLSTVTVDSEDMQTAVVKITTDCGFVAKLAAEIGEVDGYEECFSKLGESKIYELAKKYCKHAACPVPSAIMKGIEAACGLALPRDVEIKISKV